MDFCSLAERIYSFQKKYISRVLEDFVSPLNELHFHGDRRDPAPIIVSHLDYKPSFHLVSLIQVTPSSLLLSLIYPRGLCFKIKSNFTRAVERPSVCAIASIVTLCAPLAIAFWAWDQYQFCRTSSRIKPRRCNSCAAGVPSANTSYWIAILIKRLVGM